MKNMTRESVLWRKMNVVKDTLKANAITPGTKNPKGWSIQVYTSLFQAESGSQHFAPFSHEGPLTFFLSLSQFKEMTVFQKIRGFSFLSCHHVSEEETELTMLNDLLKATSLSDEAPIKTLASLLRLVLFLPEKLPMITEKTAKQNQSCRRKAHTLSKVTEFFYSKRNLLKTHTYH